MFVRDAVVAGEGLVRVRLLLIETTPGHFRILTGAELAQLAEERPGFVKSINLWRDEDD